MNHSNHINYTILLMCVCNIFDRFIHIVLIVNIFFTDCTNLINTYDKKKSFINQCGVARTSRKM